MEDSLFVITVLGKDREGLVAGITGELAAVNVNIVDIEQSVIHGLFSMFMLIDISKARINADKIKAIVYESSRELGVDINITPLSEYGEKYNEKEKKIQKITIVGRDKPGIVAGISRALSDLNMNIERIKMIARGDLLAMEMLADSKGLSLDKLKEVMKKTGDKIGVDVIVQSEDISRSRKRLVLFDMDGTIVDSEIIDELAKAAGVGKEVSELTAQGMRGEIDFEESLKKRVAMLKGLSESTLQRIRDEMKLTPGAEELINALKSMGYKIALISGGFTYFTDALKERLGFDYVYANDLVIKDGKVTGEIRGRIIDSKRKAEIMDELAKRENISREDIIAVGDGANDQIMLKNAGLGIAFNAKEVLKKVADGSISKNNLKGLMYCLGISERDLKGR
ncbi:MAG: phosphoserine phosphatase SerB [Candidatus Altiarchaeales archaeon]|nr:MAG: phosphoserine phosphatase SerB [Candidatus Altiarchaeales archaeon]